jgi:hypothetical protein
MKQIIRLEGKLHSLGIGDDQLAAAAAKMTERHGDQWHQKLRSELNALRAGDVDMSDIFDSESKSAELNVMVIVPYPILRELFDNLGLWPVIIGEFQVPDDSAQPLGIPPRANFKARRSMEGLYCSCCGKIIGLQPSGRRIRPGTRTIEGYPICSNCYVQAPGCKIEDKKCPKCGTALLIMAHRTGETIYFSCLCPKCRRESMKK